MNDPLTASLVHRMPPPVLETKGTLSADEIDFQNLSNKSYTNGSKSFDRGDIAASESREDTETVSRDEGEKETSEIQAETPASQIYPFRSKQQEGTPTKKRSNSTQKNSSNERNSTYQKSMSPSVATGAGSEGMVTPTGASTRTAAAAFASTRGNRANSSSPRLTLQQALASDNVDNEVTRLSSPSSAAIQAAAAAKSTYVVRNAHRFSSTKKRKPGDRSHGSNTLLNRLFCSSPTKKEGKREEILPLTESSTSDSNSNVDSKSSKREDHHSTVQDLLELSAPSKEGKEMVSDVNHVDDQNKETAPKKKSFYPSYSFPHKRNPNKHKKFLTATPSRKSSSNGKSSSSTSSGSSSCYDLKSALQQASENLHLNSRSEVRSTIQATLQEVILDACTTVGDRSPPTYAAASISTIESDSIISRSSGDSSISSASNQRKRNIGRRGSCEANEKSTEVSLKDGIFNTVEESSSTEEEEKPSYTSSFFFGRLSSRKKSKASSISESNRVMTGKESASSTIHNKSENLNAKPTTPSSKIGEEQEPKTPLQKSNSNEEYPKRTPGKLKIPAPFLNCDQKKLTDQRKSSAFLSSLNRTPVKDWSGTTSSNLKPKDAANENFPAAEMSDSGATAFNKSSGTNEKDDENNKISRVELIRGRSTPPLIRLTSSMEDLDTVPEVSSSKETSTILSKSFSDQKITPNPSVTFDDAQAIESGDSGDQTRQIFETPANENASKGRQYSEEELKYSIQDAVTKAKQQWQKEQEESGEQGKSSNLTQDSKKPLPNEDLQKHFEAEIQELKEACERKVKEQKDQVALANRLAKMRLEEIERMESEMKQKPDKKPECDCSARSKNSETLLREREKELDDLKKQAKEEATVLTKELEELRAKENEKSEQEERLAKELEDLKAKLDLDESKEKDQELQQVKKELVEVKEKLAAKEKETIGKARGELNRVRKELLEVKEKLAAKEKEDFSKTPSKEMKRLKKELAALKKELHEKEKEANKGESAEVKKLKQELDNLKEEVAKSQDVAKENEGDAGSHSSPELENIKEELRRVTNKLVAREEELEVMKLKVRASTPRGTPTRQSNRKIEGKSSDRDERAELWEREKESLRQQIKLLDSQAAKTSQGYEQALQELKKASEREVDLVKKDMESRLSHYLEKERVLKDSLSNVSSREKEDLLQKIERLEAEKRQERSGGLREVQRKEELLQCISSLEKKQKELVEEHERNMQEIRAQSEEEIRRLQQEMKRQEEERTAKERELRQAISQTQSFEKEDLLEKLEKLQNLLDSERSGAVLLKIKVNNFEKEMAALENNHKETAMNLEIQKNTEIKKLKEELEEKSALEEAMQIASNENEVVKKELKEVKSKLENEQQSRSKKMEEFRKRQAEEVARIKKESTERLKKVKQEMIESLSQSQKLSEEKHQKLQKQWDDKISILQKELSTKNDEYKKLLDESKQSQKLSDERHKNLQKQLEEKITTLQKELSMKSEEYKKMLDESDQIYSAEQMKLLNEINDLRGQVGALQTEIDEGDSQSSKYIQEKENEFHRRMHSVEQNFFEEKKRLRQQIDSLQKQKDQIEMKIEEKFRKDFKSQEQKLSFEKKRLLDQIDALKSQVKETEISTAKQLQEKEMELRVEFASTEKRYLYEKNELLDQLEAEKEKNSKDLLKVEDEFKESIENAKKEFVKEKDDLEKEINSLRAKLLDSNSEVEKKLLEQEKALRLEIQAAEARFTEEKTSLLLAAEKAKNKLGSEMQAAEDRFSEERANMQARFSEERRALQTQIEDVKRQKTEIEERIEEKVSEETKTLQIEIEDIKRQKIEVEDGIAEEVKKQVEEIKQKFEEEKVDLLEQIDLLDSAQKEFDKNIQQVREEHTKELDGILTQLDLVEAEHRDSIIEKEKMISEKEGIIGALGAQLGEAQRRTSSIEQKLAEQYNLTERAQIKAKSAEETIYSLKQELKTAKETHQKYIKEAEIVRNKACEEAREEMIERAEVQFKQANEHYVKLKKQFDGAQAHIAKLESRLKDTTKKLESATKERDSCEINLKAEIAHLKAALAKFQSDAAHQTREHRHEIERLIKISREFESKCKESETTSRNIQTTLATVVAEKEKLQQEYEEMKAVSEELMAMVENQENQAS